VTDVNVYNKSEKADVLYRLTTQLESVHVILLF